MKVRVGFEEMGWRGHGLRAGGEKQIDGERGLKEVWVRNGSVSLLPGRLSIGSTTMPLRCSETCQP